MTVFTLSSVPPNISRIATGEAETFGQFIEDLVVQNPSILRGANLEGKILKRVFLPPGTDCTGANFSKATLAYANVSGVIFDGCVFRGSELRSMTAKGAKFRDAMFLRSRMIAADMEGADLSGAGLQSCKARETNFAGARLDYSNIFENDLKGSNFISATVKNACVAGNDLADALLARPEGQHSSIGGPGKSGAYDQLWAKNNHYSKKTIFPSVGAFRSDRRMGLLTKAATYVPAAFVGAVVEDEAHRVRLMPWLHQSLGSMADGYGGTIFLTCSAVVATAVVGVAVSLLEDEVRETFSAIREKVERIGGALLSRAKTISGLAYIIGSQRDLGEFNALLKTIPDAWQPVEGGAKRPRLWAEKPLSLSMKYGGFGLLVCTKENAELVLAEMRRARIHAKLPVVFVSLDSSLPNLQDVPVALAVDRNGGAVARFSTGDPSADIYAKFDERGRLLFVQRANGGCQDLPADIIAAARLGVDALMRSFVTRRLQQVPAEVAVDAVRREAPMTRAQSSRASP